MLRHGHNIIVTLFKRQIKHAKTTPRFVQPQLLNRNSLYIIHRIHQNNKYHNKLLNITYNNCLQEDLCLVHFLPIKMARLLGIEILFNESLSFLVIWVKFCPLVGRGVNLEIL